MLSGFGDISGFVHTDFSRSPNVMFTEPVFANTNSIDYAELLPHIVVRSGTQPHRGDGSEPTLAWSDNYGFSWNPLTVPALEAEGPLNFEGKLQTAVQMTLDASAEPGNSVDRVNYVTDHTLQFDGWAADIAYGTFRRMARSDNQPEHPDGRILIAELGDGQFLLAGYHSRVMFRPTGQNADRPWQYLTVEEGTYVDGQFKADRILNGDQTDWGLNFPAPTVLRVSLYTR